MDHMNTLNQDSIFSAPSYLECSILVGSQFQDRGYYQQVGGRDQGSRTYISDWLTYHKIAKEFPGVKVENAEKGRHKLH